MSNNKAAWIPAAQEPFTVDNAPMPEPLPHEVVIRNHAVAINPIDAHMQAKGFMIPKYPAIVGCDGAGQISAVGSAVTKFKVGDRVAAYFDGIEADKTRTTNVAFQLYAATSSQPVAKLPSHVSYAQGSVLGLALCTASTALFEPNALALQLPRINAKPTGKVVLVWGGSSSVGACAIQLLRGAGYEVATTASARNADFCTELGANYVFDHAKEGVVDEIAAKLSGMDSAGAFCAIMTPETIRMCAQIVKRIGGTQFVGTVLAPGMPGPDDMPEGVKYSTTWGGDPATSEAGKVIWGEWVPAALENGALKCKPDPLVVGQGLEHVQTACNRWQQGVSGQKVVVEIP